jgi:hypothetical protein
MYAIIIIIVISTLFSNKREFKLWLLLIFSIEVFSIWGGANVPQLPIPGLGTLHIKDIILIYMLLTSILIGTSKSYPKQKILFEIPLIILLIIGVINALIDIIEGHELHYILRGVRYVIYYFAYYITLKHIKSKELLYRFLYGIVVISLISSIIVYLQFSFGWSLSGGKVNYMDSYGFFRVFNSSGAVTSGCLLVLLSIGLSGNVKSRQWRVLLWASFVILLGSQIIIFSRSRWIYVLLGIVLVILFQRKHLLRKLSFIILISITLYFTVGSSITSFSGNSHTSLWRAIVLRSNVGLDNILYRDGSFDIRLSSLSLRTNTVFNSNPLIGIGFESANYVDISSYSGNKIALKLHESPNALVPDISWANIILLFGMLGVISFIWLFISLLRYSYRLYNNLPQCLEKSITLGIIALNITTIMSSFFSSSALTGPSGVTFLSMSWAVVVLIDRYNNPLIDNNSMDV